MAKENEKRVPKLRFKGFTDDWEQRKLGDTLVELKSGLSRMLSNKDIGVPVIRANNIKNGMLDLKADIKYWYSDDPQGANIENYLVEKENILINFINSESKMGTAAIVREAISRNTIYTTNILKAQTNNDFNSYFWFTLTQTLQYKNSIKMITKPAVNQSSFTTVDFKKLIFAFPILSEQTKIGNFIKLIDNTITLHQRKLAQLEKLKQALLQQMFPKKDETVPKLRFANFNEDWKQCKLGSIYDFSKGKGLPLNSFTYSKDDPAIAYGHLYTKYSEVISEVYLSSNDQGVLSKDNDLLFPGSSTVPNGTAQANAITLNNIKLGGDIIIGRPKQNVLVSSIFMSYQINSQRQKLFPITVGTTITHMYGKDLSKIKFSITSYSEQEKISEFFKQLDNMITLHQEKLEHLNLIKQSLLQNMFT